jgi:hypothetical protein
MTSEVTDTPRPGQPPVPDTAAARGLLLPELVVVVLAVPGPPGAGLRDGLAAVPGPLVAVPSHPNTPSTWR